MKKLPPVLIVADRGRLVAYDCDFHTGGSVPRVLAEISFTEGHELMRDRVTDQAGSFPSDGTMGRGNSMAERGSLLMEMDQQAFRRIGNCINHLLARHHAGDWGFAAPPGMNRQILEHVSREYASLLTANLSKDLTKIPPAELLEHFEAAEMVT